MIDARLTWTVIAGRRVHVAVVVLSLSGGGGAEPERQCDIGSMVLLGGWRARQLLERQWGWGFCGGRCERFL